MAQALYRRYRPQTFSNVVGQTYTVAVLREAVRQNRLTHAYLLAGPRGAGKTSIARILAKAVNCSNPIDGNPCLTCESCQAIDQGQHLDVIEIDAASNRGIDEMRDIRERIAHRPAMGKMKVYIIDEVHMLTSEAFNALLKTLEEPPAYVIFILATTESQKLPITVLSRCQRYEFQRLTIPLIQGQLKYVLDQEQVAYEPAALELISEFADGAMRDALSLLDQAMAVHETVTLDSVSALVGALDDQFSLEIMDTLANGTVAELVRVLEKGYAQGKDIRQILRDMARKIRDIVIVRTGGSDAIPSYRREHIVKIEQMLPPGISDSQWFKALDYLAEGDARLRGGFPPQLVVELSFFKVKQMLTEIPSPDPLPAAPQSKRELPIPRREAVDETRVQAVPPIRQKAEEKASYEVIEAGSSGTNVGGDLASRFPQVLEAIRRERASTFALLEPTQQRATESTVLTIYFTYASHLDIFKKQAKNKEIFDEIFQRVYGPSVRYDLVLGKPDNISSGAQGTTVNRALERDTLQSQVKEWFGEDIRLEGFDNKEE